MQISKIFNKKEIVIVKGKNLPTFTLGRKEAKKIKNELKKPSKKQLLENAIKCYQLYKEDGELNFFSIDQPIKNETAVLFIFKTTAGFSNKQMRKIVKSIKY